MRWPRMTSFARPDRVGSWFAIRIWGPWRDRASRAARCAFAPCRCGFCAQADPHQPRAITARSGSQCPASDSRVKTSSAAPHQAHPYRRRPTPLHAGSGNGRRLAPGDRASKTAHRRSRRTSRRPTPRRCRPCPARRRETSRTSSSPPARCQTSRRPAPTLRRSGQRPRNSAVGDPTDRARPGRPKR